MLSQSWSGTMPSRSPGTVTNASSSSWMAVTDNRSPRLTPLANVFAAVEDEPVAVAREHHEGAAARVLHPPQKSRSRPLRRDSSLACSAVPNRGAIRVCA